ncbi:MAG: hypothetical protein ACOYYJ_20505 [Chloroflexota bacterium]
MKTRAFLLLFLLLSFLVTACEGTTPTVEATSTPDPCGPENIKAEVEKIHRWMREFDDASVLAANTPREQLNPEIAALQAIRRSAEDQPAPVCLRDLKAYQVNHMNTVIDTLISFIGGTADQEMMNQGIAQARQQHDQYALEMARLLGVTVVANTPPPETVTP